MSIQINSFLFFNLICIYKCMRGSLNFIHKIEIEFKRIDFYLNGRYFLGGRLVYFNEYENWSLYIHISKSHNDNIYLLQDDFFEYIDQNVGKLYEKEYYDVGDYYFKLNNEISLKFIT